MSETRFSAMAVEAAILTALKLAEDAGLESVADQLHAPLAETRIAISKRPACPSDYVRQQTLLDRIGGFDRPLSNKVVAGSC